MDKKRQMQLLIAKLNKATEAYDKGLPYITDKEWDDLYFQLKELEKQEGYILKGSPTVAIKYKIVNSLKKVKHNHPMLSLDKTKNWDEFIKYFGNKDVIGTIKLDGLTCSLCYKDGELVSAETRGNGEIGEDILHNARIIKSIPNRIDYKDTLIIDGEIICTYNNFEKFKNEYKNPRNFAAGSIRLLDSKECEKRNLTFVAWNVVKGFEEEDSFLKCLVKLDDLGFFTTPYTSSFDWDAKDFLQNQAEKLGFPIDGLVGRFDSRSYGESLGATSHHANAAYAFKFYDETYETKLLDITYDVSRNGEMVPVAVFEPIEIDGSTVERASLHNLSVMEELSKKTEFVGDILHIYKANAIIPQVEEWEHEEIPTGKIIELPKVCPICGQPTEIKVSDTGIKSLYCVNELCERRTINYLDHFCGKTGLDIKGLSKATLEKLIDWGFVNGIQDIYNLKTFESEWEKKPGFGPKSVSNILSAIEGSKNCELANFICALGIPEIGSTASKLLASIFKTWDGFIRAVEDSKYHFYHIDTIGPEMDYAIKHFNYTTAKELALLMNFKEVKVIDKKQDITVVITGKLKKFKNRDELKAKIEEIGGKVSGSVSSKTTCLINNDNTSETSKNVSAKKLNVPILTEEEFIEKYF